MKLITKISVILGIIIALSSLIGSLFFIDDRYAKAIKVIMVELRLDQKIVQDRVDHTQEQIWDIEDRYRDAEKPQDVIDRERRLKKQLKESEDQLERLKDKETKR